MKMVIGQSVLLAPLLARSPGVMRLTKLVLAKVEQSILS